MIRRPRRWLGVVAVGWAVALIAAGTWSARHGRPTVAAQTTIVRAVPVADRALALVVGAAGPGVVVAASGYVRTRATCAVGNRDGERYERSVALYTGPGTEPAVVDRIAAALPASYRPFVRHAGDVHTLRADAGYYVRLTGGMSGAGELRFTVDTDCRVRGGDLPGAGPGADAGPAAGPLAEVLARIGGTEARRESHEVACPTGGRVRTVAVTVTNAARPPGADAPAGVTPVVARDGLLAYRAGDVGVVVRERADDLLVTATTGC